MNKRLLGDLALSVAAVALAGVYALVVVNSGPPSLTQQIRDAQRVACTTGKIELVEAYQDIIILRCEK